MNACRDWIHFYIIVRHARRHVIIRVSERVYVRMQFVCERYIDYVRVYVSVSVGGGKEIERQTDRETDTERQTLTDRDTKRL